MPAADSIHKSKKIYHRFIGFRKTSTQNPVKRKSLSQKLIDALQEWGGVATLMIALLYTFPIGIFDRFTSGREKDLTQIRQTLADGSSMMIEKLLNIPRITYPRSVEMMNNMYNVKFFNLIYSNKSALKEKIHYLGSSELALAAELHAFSGLTADALEYYEASIQKAKTENIPYANILRDMAQILTLPGPSHDMKKARDNYVEALNFFAKDADNPAAKRQFAVFFAELAYYEAAFGDWACGMTLKQEAEDMLNWTLSIDPTISTIQVFMAQSFSKLSQKSKQSAVGCDFELPKLAY